MANPAPQPVKPDTRSHECAQAAFALMQKHHVAPSPDNYAVWFAYAQGKSKELVAEADKIAAGNLPFSDDTCAYLYHKYVAPSRVQKTADDVSATTQKVLKEVLKVVNDFSGEQQNYNKDVGNTIERIVQVGGDENVQNIVKELVAATTSLKQSGENISKKLEESKKEIDGLRKNLQEVTQESQRDHLTGIYNRKTFEKMFDEHAAVAKEKGTETCLIMIDIDHFKNFNDRFGHLWGDEVLKIVGRALTDSLKGRDVVARFGGEEFVVVLPETPIEGAMKAAEIIRATIAGKELKRKDTGEKYGTITVSMGVARFRPENDTLPALIKRADDALYKSKHEGRNRVTKEA